jgi:hypothetical protein
LECWDCSGHFSAAFGLGDFLCRSQLLHVEKILLPATSEFVPNQIFFGDDGGRDITIDPTFDSMLPRIVESYPVNALQDIDSFRRLSHLEDSAIPEIGRTHPAQRRAKGNKGLKDDFTVFFV